MVSKMVTKLTNHVIWLNRSIHVWSVYGWLAFQVSITVLVYGLVRCQQYLFDTCAQEPVRQIMITSPALVFIQESYINRAIRKGSLWKNCGVALFCVIHIAFSHVWFSGCVATWTVIQSWIATFCLFILMIYVSDGSNWKPFIERQVLSDMLCAGALAANCFVHSVTQPSVTLWWIAQTLYIIGTVGFMNAMCLQLSNVRRQQRSNERAMSISLLLYCIFHLVHYNNVIMWSFPWKAEDPWL
ncbi:rh197 [macacine betaherpesvirus 3]|uniref:Rh197 n=1 Tax=Rhesus cytomegalovirus (strain 68-1) TaxID=47929 RepID=Q2FAA0_RHCM6|nr:rh197 [macacine betaherpesvirus 3]QXV50532.1 membrane protein US12E [macacine betaherpesvirus 3]